MELMEEIWKDVVEYEGLYRVSNLGRIFSLYKNQNKFLKPVTRSNGYKTVQLRKHEISKEHMFHRIVATAFIPNPYNKPCVNHIDGSKINNASNNLEWCSYSENIHHAYNIGLMKSGKDHPQSKKIDQFDLDGNFIQTFSTLTEAAKSVNALICSISACANYRSKFSSGYVWRYTKDF